MRALAIGFPFVALLCARIAQAAVSASLTGIISLSATTIDPDLSTDTWSTDLTDVTSVSLPIALRTKTGDVLTYVQYPYGAQYPVTTDFCSGASGGFQPATLTYGMFSGSADTTAWHTPESYWYYGDYEPRLIDSQATGSGTAELLFNYIDEITVNCPSLARGTPVQVRVGAVMNSILGFSGEHGSLWAVYGVALQGYGGVSLNHEITANGIAGSGTMSDEQTIDVYANVPLTLVVSGGIAAVSRASGGMAYIPPATAYASATMTGSLWLAVDSPDFTIVSASGANYVPEPSVCGIVASGFAVVGLRRCRRH